MGKHAATARATRQHLHKQSDAGLRANFLYQGAAMLAAARSPAVRRVSRVLAATCQHVASRSVLRMAPGVKHTLCKHCSTVLLPGLSSHVTYIGDQQSRLEIQCSTCGRTRRFLMAQFMRAFPEASPLLVAASAMDATAPSLPDGPVDVPSPTLPAEVS